MKKLIFIALAGVIGLAGCQKEENTGAPAGGATEGITTLSATMGPVSKVDIIPGSAVEPDPTGVDQVLWKEGDQLKLHALKLSEYAMGYELENSTASFFTIDPATAENPAVGPGNKAANFSLTSGNALDPSKMYLVLHSGNMATLSTSLGITGALCVKHTPPSAASPTSEQLGSGNDLWCEDAMAFWGVLRFVDGVPQIISMEAFTQIFEFHIKTVPDVDGFELKSLRMSFSSPIVLMFQALLLDLNLKLTTEVAVAVVNFTSTMPTSQPVVVPANGDGELVLRMPVAFRVSGSETDSETVYFSITPKEGNAWNINKTRNKPAGATSLFPGNTTYVVDLTITE